MATNDSASTPGHTGKNNTAPGKGQAPANDIPSLSLPKGGGAIQSIGEKFSANAINGTAGFTIPFPLSPSRNGFVPNVALAYNSGGGNSPFGLGWKAEPPSIQRRTDQQLPTYQDADEADTFLYSGEEDLIPAYDKDKLGKWNKEEKTIGPDRVRRYRPRVEGAFARIEKVTEPTGNIYWRVISRENITSIFGKSTAARIADPNDPTRIFKWLLEFSSDDKGNCYAVEYKTENLDLVAKSLHEKNRLNNSAKFTNTYLKKIRYGNKESYLTNTSPEFLQELVLDYGEHDPVNPQPDDTGLWACRPDAFSDHHACFEIRTYRLCQRVLMFHNFLELGTTPCLIRSLQLHYDSNQTFSFLTSCTQAGFIRKQDGSYRSKTLPPYEFTYQALGWDTAVHSISSANIAHAPQGIDDKNYQWTDLYGEGVSGILTEQANTLYYKSNLGKGTFTPASAVAPKPSYAGVSTGVLQLADLDAKGMKNLLSREEQGSFELDAAAGWLPFRAFGNNPNINWSDPNLKMLDLNGDGTADILITEDDVFTWYPSLGTDGFDSACRVQRASDEETGPDIVFAFADSSLSIVLADMSGDGLTDIVRIRNGEVVYWPNLGYGRFGAKISMSNAPVFDYIDQFNPLYVKLADIDGSGTTDLVYLGKDTFKVYFNQSGNSFSAEKVITPFLKMDETANVSFIDLLGNGTNCITWSSPLPANAHAPLQYMDLMGGKKPHLMTGYKNNLGKEVIIHYKPSTYYYLQDKLAGRPWVTKLPFPVQCLSQVETIDRVSRTRFASEYTYHHGFYDYAEKEFRGFGRVEQTDSDNFEVYVNHVDPDGTQSFDEQVYQKPVLTKSWFHTGAFFQRGSMRSRFESEYYQNPNEYTISEAPLPDNLSTEEYREAFRAGKGLALRTEVYCLDGSAAEKIPYTTSLHTCSVQLVQARLQNKYASFLVKEHEVLTCNYERNANDPRILHAMNIDIDPYGNVLQSAAIAYGRLTNDPDLAAEDQLIQSQTHIVYTLNAYTNNIDGDTDYRLPLLSETQTYEVTGAIPEANGFFLPDKMRDNFKHAAVLNYEDLPAGTLQKRMTQDVRHYYRKDDLSAVLDLNTCESKALPYRSVRLALTPTLLTARFGSAISSSILLNEGHYISSEGDSNFWVPSPVPSFDPAHFYQVIQETDALGNVTNIGWDATYHFYMQTILSPPVNGTNNTSQVMQFSFRTLHPYVLKDINDNLSAIRMDEMGLVIATFSMGKDGENKGDRFDSGSTEASPNDTPGKAMEYTLDNWYNQSRQAGFDYTNYKPLPNVVKLSAREQHYYDNPNPKIQVSYSYSDGSGNEVMKKVQAEQGDVTLPNGTVQHNVNPRWVGNGRTILNNKGNTVKQFEPFFSTTFAYEDDKDLVQGGVTPVIYYDPLSRVIRTEFPDGTLSTTEFNAWKQIESDPIDNVLKSTWYSDRGSPLPTDPQPFDKETRAAWLAAILANTPTAAYFDSQGRAFLSQHFNRTFGIDGVSQKAINISDEHYKTKTILDIESNEIEVIDARSNTAMQYAYDMQGHKVYQKSMDAGERWLLGNCLGKPLRNFDSLTPFPSGGVQHIFSYQYDTLLRPVKSYVSKDGAPGISYEQVVYGEGQAGDKAQNLRGQTYQHFDTAGQVKNTVFDFKGNLLTSQRQVLSDYKNEVNWNLAPVLDIDIYTLSTSYDALNRPVHITAPDTSIITPTYTEANLLGAVDVNIQGSSVLTNFVKNIHYNEKAQRASIIYGNNVRTGYTYDAKTFRLTEILTTGKNGTDLLQQLTYTFDPVGNITSVKDQAQQTYYFSNNVVNPSNDYVYDAVYRLIAANGREHIGQNKAISSQDEFRTNMPQPGDGTAMRNYSQHYQYDAVGNMLQMIHLAGAGSWTRGFNYETLNNRLKNDTVSGSTETPAYDLHGNTTSLATMPGMNWNFNDQLEQVNLVGGGKVYFTYDSSGTRVRKVNEQLGGLIKERIYLGIFELYRERNANGITFERQTLHVMDDRNRIALIETRTKGKDESPTQVIRYQYSNHLGSASLELDDQGTVISYEEYYSFGSTSYQAVNATIRAAAKRYRFTGVERDEETGLEYHGARYYIPWLARWIKPDPTGIKAGINDYVYSSNNPVMKVDLNGADDTKPWQLTYTPLVLPVYQSTGDQAGTDAGKLGKVGLKLAPETDEFKLFKKLELDPRLAELKKDIGLDWEKNPGSLITGAIVIGVPTIGLLSYFAVANPKLQVPIVGDFYPRQGVFALGSALTEAATEGLTNERVKFGFSYEKKSGTDVYGFDLTLKGPKAPEDKDKPKSEDKKGPEKTDPSTSGTPAAATPSPQQKQKDAAIKEINAPGSVTISTKIATNKTGEGSITIAKPTDIGRVSFGPKVVVGPQGPSLSTNLSVTSLILGQRFQFTGSAFLNAPKPDPNTSPFDVKYSGPPANTLTVTTTPPLSGNGFWVGVVGNF